MDTNYHFPTSGPTLPTLPPNTIKKIVSLGLIVSVAIAILGLIKSTSPASLPPTLPIVLGGTLTVVLAVTTVIVVLWKRRNDAGYQYETKDFKTITEDFESGEEYLSDEGSNEEKPVEVKNRTEIFEGASVETKMTFINSYFTEASLLSLEEVRELYNQITNNGKDEGAKKKLTQQYPKVDIKKLENISS